jgi:hypothetical protein
MQSFMICMSISVANENDVSSTKQEVHEGKDTEQTPQSKVSKIIIAFATFFHSLIISYHI